MPLIVQVATYGHTLQKEISNANENSRRRINAFDPRLVAIIGSKQSLRDDRERQRSFELYRARTTGVLVITFDELFEKTERLIQLLEMPPAGPSSKLAPDEFPEDIPF